MWPSPAGLLHVISKPESILVAVVCEWQWILCSGPWQNDMDTHFLDSKPNYI